MERDFHVAEESKKAANWLKIEDSPVVASQGRVARAPWRLRIIGSGYRKLRAANRLLARLLRTRSYLKRRAGRGSCSYGPRRPAKIQIETNQWLAHWQILLPIFKTYNKWFLLNSREEEQWSTNSTVTYYRLFLSISLLIDNFLFKWIIYELSIILLIRFLNISKNSTKIIRILYYSISSLSSIILFNYIIILYIIG